MKHLRKPRRILFQLVLWTMMFGWLLAHPTYRASSSPPGEKSGYVLVLNTYFEASPWSQNIITRILSHISTLGDCEVYTENLTMLLVHKDRDFAQFEQYLRDTYATHRPRALVLLGAPSSQLLGVAEELWPEVPVIFCSETDYTGPRDAYIDRRAILPEERIPIRSLTTQHNLTMLLSPLYLRGNVELARRMVPGMDEVVLISDGRYVTRQVEYDLRRLLRREYPGMKYRAFSAADLTTEALLDSLKQVDTRRTGILFASWNRVKRIGPNALLADDSFRVIASVGVGMFSLMPVGVGESGLLGGYLYDTEAYDKRLVEVLDAVLSGVPPRDIPFYVPFDAQPILSYPALKRNGFNPDDCPSSTVFLDEPASFWDKYRWAILACLLLLAVFVAIQQWRITMLTRIETERRRAMENQVKYSNLFNGMPILYIQHRVLYDDKGNPSDVEFTDVNAYFERQFKPREQIIGRRSGEVTPRSTEEFFRMVRLVLEERRTVTFSYYHPPRDIYYEVIMSRSYLKDHIDLFCLDGTALYKAQRKLASINSKLSMALDVANIVPWRWDLVQQTITCDMGRSAGESYAEQQIVVPAERYFSIIHKGDRDRVQRMADDLCSGRAEKLREEYRIFENSKGHWTMEWVEVKATVERRDDEGRPVALVGSSLITTERKLMEQELLSARDRAEESNRLKSAFLANMSHEIRTPLNAIVGFSGILASADDPGEKQQYVSIIENNNTLLLQLIGDILDLSKIEAGTLEFVETDFELTSLMREKEEIMRLRVQPGVELRYEGPAGPLWVRTDRNRLSQVISNLLTNAVKFTPRGSIRFGFALDGAVLRFHVTDTGCGIPLDLKDAVFDRFIKLNTFKQGTGLGLSICKTIVEHWGGHIGVESEEGKGASFSFTLPYTPGHPVATADPTLPTRKVDKDKLTLLIAEDNESNYRLFETILRRDYHLLHAWTGREAVELYRQHRPHLVLMDINMPEMNGYEATAEIRKLSADVPIIAVTAFAYASDEQKVLANGFDGYMSKPIQAVRLRQLVLDYLHKRLTLI